MKPVKFVPLPNPLCPEIELAEVGDGLIVYRPKIDVRWFWLESHEPAPEVYKLWMEYLCSKR